MRRNGATRAFLAKELHPHYTDKIAEPPMKAGFKSITGADIIRRIRIISRAGGAMLNCANPATLSDEGRINIDVAGVFRGRRRVFGGFPGEAFENRWIDLQIVIKGGYIESAVQAAS